MIKFTVPGTPQPWRRARIGRVGGKTIHFTDPRTKTNEAHWASAALTAMKGAPLMTGPLRADITVRFLPPKTLTKARAFAIACGVERPTKTPDADNVAKNLDGLNGVAFRDDAQIVELFVSKIYADSAGVDVVIKELS